MYLTIKDLGQYLRIKPSTLYAWVAQGKIPFLKIHGLIRFRIDEIDHWVESFREELPRPPSRFFPSHSPADVDTLIVRAKREAYTARYGETITPSPTRKE